ncbi:cupredoxin domain-containing protein [Cytobacillus purgationiresistens]|uniref:Heme/copper-type cytochrome/quinol oxidase subunit 2 n=1 Tax=Cytobacillus purgationiresistens TaxID=863449 RepID=A0ABU0AB04_9BACI|nr:cupredoxin domain-containing protein [Cytobacillus purgationiresistens]MDQ0268427.1 heme/copper-type cytochrome/quinol oxidase subunit 2 [Cytobacillus purgationiresistens]
MQFLVIKKRSIITALLVFAIIVSASVWFFSKSGSVSVFSSSDDKNVREIHMVTGEYKTKMPSGEEVEVYRWDPGTIFLEKGEKVNLKILGVMGSEHPFYIEGTDIKGTVAKGEETVVPLEFDKKGTYQLICDTHAHHGEAGQMIAYIVVK